MGNYALCRRKSDVIPTPIHDRVLPNEQLSDLRLVGAAVQPGPVVGHTIHIEGARTERVMAKRPDTNKFQRVIRRFVDQSGKGAFPGGQLVLHHHGQSVLSEVVGMAKGYRRDEGIPPVPVQPNTLFPVLSAGKPMAAITIAWLEDQGRLDIDAPVAECFPEVARHGKDKITTKDVLTHRSGLLMPDFVAQPHKWADRQAVQKALIETKPTYPHGTLAYHPHEYGWLLNEICLRLDGRGLPQLFAEEFADPLGLQDIRYGLGDRDPHRLGFIYWLGKEKVMVAGQNVAAHFEEQNSPLYLEAQNPATSMVTDASSLAAFYDFILAGGVTSQGSRLLSHALVETYTTLQVQGWDRSLRTPNALGYGFMVGGRGPSSFGWWGTQGCFGHGGGFCCVAFGDKQKGLSIAIVTNGNRSLLDSMLRIVPLAHALRNAV